MKATINRGRKGGVTITMKAGKGEDLRHVVDALAQPRKPRLITSAQYHGLKKYEDEQAHRLSATGLRRDLFYRLKALGLLRGVITPETARITPAGRSALERFEQKQREKQARA